MIYLVISVLGAAIAAMVASSKSRNALGWGALGFLLPLIGVIIVCCLPAKPSQQLQQGAS